MSDEKLREILAQEYEAIAPLKTATAAAIRSDQYGSMSDIPYRVAMAALRRVFKAVAPVGEPMDPRFIPTKGDLTALRNDCAALGRSGLPVTVNVAPTVLYVAWPNGQYDPTNPDSTRYRCISFNIPKPE